MLRYLAETVSVQVRAPECADDAPTAPAPVLEPGLDVLDRGRAEGRGDDPAVLVRPREERLENLDHACKSAPVSAQLVFLAQEVQVD